MNEGGELPSLNLSNPKYQLARKGFSSMPIWMAQEVGSWLVKRAPWGRAGSQLAIIYT